MMIFDGYQLKTFIVPDFKLISKYIDEFFQLKKFFFDYDRNCDGRNLEQIHPQFKFLKFRIYGMNVGFIDKSKICHFEADQNLMVLDHNTGNRIYSRDMMDFGSRTLRMDK